MKNPTLLLSLFLLGILLMPNVLANGQETGGCCIIKDCCLAGDQDCIDQTQCTYWDMSGWSYGEEFCAKLKLWGYASETVWYSKPCTDLTEEEKGDCNDGNDIPEFNTITAGLAFAGAGIGFIFLRKKR